MTEITTVFDALRVGSVVSNKKANYGEYARLLADEILDLRATGALRISHFLHLRAEVCSETLIDELAKFGPDDRIGIVSLMDHTPGQRQFRDLTQLRAYVCGKHGLNESEFESHVEGQIALSARLGAAQGGVGPAQGLRRLVIRPLRAQGDAQTGGDGDRIGLARQYKRLGQSAVDFFGH